MQQPFAKAAQSGGAFCEVPKTVAPFFAEKSETTLRAIVHGSSCQAPRAQPNESIRRRFTSWTTFFERSSKLREQAKAASWCARVGFVIEKVNLQCGDETRGGKPFPCNHVALSTGCLRSGDHGDRAPRLQFFEKPGYSGRSAAIGLIRVERRAGSQVASKA